LPSLRELRRRSSALLDVAGEVSKSDVRTVVGATARDRNSMLDGRQEWITAPAEPDWKRVHWVAAEVALPILFQPQDREGHDLDRLDPVPVIGPLNLA
jgi:hypothetical protein